MGLYDEVVFDTEVPDMPSSTRRFQTKSLDCSLDYYIVTKEGRLCLAGNSVASEGAYEEYIARFTHGTLEWVRPFDKPRAPRWQQD